MDPTQVNAKKIIRISNESRWGDGNADQDMVASQEGVDHLLWIGCSSMATLLIRVCNMNNRNIWTKQEGASFGQ